MKLTFIEKLDLAQLKKTITEHYADFWKLIDAVTEIRDRKLWREEAKSAEEFFKKNWNFSSRWSRYLADAGHVIQAEKLLVETGQKDEKDSKILQATTVTEAVELAKEEGKLAPIDKTKTEQDKTDSSHIEPRDNLGVVIPEPCRPLWDRSDEVRGLIHQLQSVKRVLDKVQADGKDPLWAEVGTQDAILEVKNAIRQLKNAVPYAVCPYCQGVLTKTCSFCYHRGLVSQWRLDTADQELVKMQMRKGQQHE